MFHVLPVNDLKPHVESGPYCWCSPKLERQCQQCDGSDPSCWQCGGFKWIEATPAEAQLVVHNAADGRG